jgi:hypothetical protein
MPISVCAGDCIRRFIAGKYRLPIHVPLSFDEVERRHFRPLGDPSPVPIPGVRRGANHNDDQQFQHDRDGAHIINNVHTP